MTPQPFAFDFGFLGIFQFALHNLKNFHEKPFDANELACICGFAFQHNIYDPQLNVLKENEPLDWFLTLLFSNFGPLEALAYFTQSRFQSLNHISKRDFIQLIKQETLQGRPALTFGILDDAHPVAVLQVHDEDPRDRQLTILRPHRPNQSTPDHVEKIPITSFINAQDHLEFFQNFLILVQPLNQELWTSSQNKQRLTALRWASSHATLDKEFFHETRANYIPGLAAYDTLQQQINELDTLFAPDHQDAGNQYFIHHLKQLAFGRNAAAQTLPLWADLITEDPEIKLKDPQGFKENLLAAAEFYEHFQQHLAPLQLNHNRKLSHQERTQFANTITTIKQLDEKATQHLAAATNQIPPFF